MYVFPGLLPLLNKKNPFSPFQKPLCCWSALDCNHLFLFVGGGGGGMMSGFQSTSMILTSCRADSVQPHVLSNCFSSAIQVSAECCLEFAASSGLSNVS